MQFKLVSLPEHHPLRQVPVNQKTIVTNSFRRIANFVKLDRMSEAAETAQRLSGILRCWQVKTK